MSGCSFLEDKLFEFDEHIVVIVLKKRIPKSSILYRLHIYNSLKRISAALIYAFQYLNVGCSLR